jgi:hypothetical protein
MRGDDWRSTMRGRMKLVTSTWTSDGVEGRAIEE